MLYLTVLNKGRRYKHILLMYDSFFQKLGILIDPQLSRKAQSRWPLGNSMAGANPTLLYLGISTCQGGIFITVTNNDQSKHSIFHFNISSLNQKTEGGLRSL